MKKFIKKITPQFLVSLYHYLAVKSFKILYRNPSEKMIIIGVTGTKGKSTMSNMIWSVLSAAGLRVGLTGTANFRIGNKEVLNPFRMTMPGPKVLYKMLAKMKKAKCGAAVVETTSQGIVQHRHLGINYDIAVFTNLAPEHIESHGSFEKYKQAKGKFFKHLGNSNRKFFGKKMLPKKMIVFGDDPAAKYFLQFPADEKITFGLDRKNNIVARDVVATGSGIEFTVGSEKYRVPIIGKFNVENALGAVAVGKALGLDYKTISKGLSALPQIPGRMEKIETKKPFTVIVDYAYEPKSIEAILQTARTIASGKVILLTGSMGGGRDKWRRKVIGELGAKQADYLIVANEDPCEEDPQAIIDEIANSAKENGKNEGKDLFEFLDRREGIRKALELAQLGDVVLIAGKGADQKLMVGETKGIPWDDRQVVREELKKIK